MKTTSLQHALTLALAASAVAAQTASSLREQPRVGASHKDLVTFFLEWREFQKPGVVAGVPDYSRAAMAKQQASLREVWQPRLRAIEVSSWSLFERNDYRIVEAELNGLDFDHRVLKPWANDPSFYVMALDSESDVPAREGAIHLAATDLWKYTPPLSADDVALVRLRLLVIPAVLDQAKVNLTGDVRDLWLLGVRNAAAQKTILEEFAQRAESFHPDLAVTARQASVAFAGFGAWLAERLPMKKSRAGVGVANYDWYAKNVHMSPYTYADEVLLMERELARARTYLALVEHENRDQPPQTPIDNAEEFHRLFGQGVTDFMKFLEVKDVMTVKPWMDLALREREGGFEVASRRDFFAQVEFRDPRVMRCHGTHWFDRARAKHEPHPSLIRQTPSLYNIWDSRAEGLATAAEEILMGAGLFADRPRARELVYILVANRAARGLAGLKVHSGELSVEQALAFAHENTPRSWLLKDGGTNWAEQELYLRQPGYGTSYLVGKLQIEKLLGDVAHRQGAAFSLRRFFDDFHAAGMMPVALISAEMRAAAKP